MKGAVTLQEGQRSMGIHCLGCDMGQQQHEGPGAPLVLQGTPSSPARRQRCVGQGSLRQAVQGGIWPLTEQ